MVSDYLLDNPVGFVSRRSWTVFFHLNSTTPFTNGEKQEPVSLRAKMQMFKVAVWFFIFAVPTGLEPATSGVTGRHSNQLNYSTSGEEMKLTLRQTINSLFDPL